MMFALSLGKHHNAQHQQIPVIKQGYLKKKSMGLNPFGGFEILYFFLKGQYFWGYKHQGGHGKPNSQYNVKQCIIQTMGSNQFKLLQKTGKLLFWL
jgi:hypothetical protein